MRKSAALAALTVVAVLFLFFVTNRAAWRGYFSDDDLDNISWTTQQDGATFIEGLLSPRYFPNHFRPVGHYTFHLLGKRFGLDFRPYVALIQVLHLINGVLVYLLLRRLRVDPAHAACGAIFFLFHMGLFEALWKPMYLFDVWCCLFCLLTLLLYLHGHVVPGLIAFWLAYKSKELAVALPAVLACYEYLLGERRWRRVLPFAAIAFLFTVQALFRNKQAGGDYALSASPAALWSTISFYGARAMLFPAGLAVLVLALAASRDDRRAWWALASSALLLAPMLAVPSRLYGAYLYTATAALAVFIGVALVRFPWWMAAVFFALWLPMNYQRMRMERRAALQAANENRHYVERLGELHSRHPAVSKFLYDGHPAALRWWGIRAALRMLYKDQSLEVDWLGARAAGPLVAAGDTAVLTWNPEQSVVSILARGRDEPDASEIAIGPDTPLWQLEEGWYQPENKFRWTQPRAVARLRRPADAREFYVVVNIGPRYIADVRRAHLRVLLDGRQIGSHEFTGSGWQTVRFPLPPAGGGSARIEFLASPEYRPSGDPRVLGLAIGAFGFHEQKQENPGK